MQPAASTTTLWQLLLFLLDEECATSLPECLKATRIIERERPKFEALYRSHRLHLEKDGRAGARCDDRPAPTAKAAA